MWRVAFYSLFVILACWWCQARLFHRGVQCSRQHGGTQWVQPKSFLAHIDATVIPFCHKRHTLVPLLWVWPTNNTLLFLSLSAVIGRGGEQINKIQQESGCKVQIAPGTVFFYIIICNVIFLLLLRWVTYVLCLCPDSRGLPDRSVSLTGSPESIQ